MHLSRITTCNSSVSDLLRFSYPEESRMAWQAYLNEKREEGSDVAMDLGRVSIEDIHTNYEISGDAPSWRPVAVYDNGEKTCIKMPQGLHTTEAPALLLQERKKTRIVNYRVRDGCYVVDRLFDKAVLISGVGKEQQRVEIERTRRRR
jgi:P-type conjugative transfer protein TrbG